MINVDKYLLSERKKLVGGKRRGGGGETKRWKGEREREYLFVQWKSSIRRVC